MKNIVLFSQEESETIDKVLNVLNMQGKAEEISNVNDTKNALQRLADSISLYPSIFKEQHLGNAVRTAETLVHSLCSDRQLELKFHIPTKALLGNGFLIAKINFFFMLSYVASEIPELKSTSAALKNIIKNIVFTLTAEEVFLSIIEDNVSRDIKIKAGYLLANIWEYRLDHGVREFAPILSNIWRASGVIRPTFGTMLGFSELFKISEQIEAAFLSFLQRDDLSDEEVESIEEFIFGLSYEEAGKIKNEMKKMEKAAISRKDVENIIGVKRTYPAYNIADPRELYRSFNERRINARYRARSGLKGPKKTFEEYLMCYLLSQADIIGE